MTGTNAHSHAQISDSLVHAIAGAGGGVLSMALTYPLIAVSTRLQVYSRSTGKSSEKPLTQIETARKILREEGVAGLYSGMKSALFGVAFTQAIYYYWYELIKAGFEAKLAAGEAITIAESIITSTIAGSITSTVTNPIWVINTRLLVKDDTKGSKGKRIGMKEAALKIYKEDGIVGFWRGLLPALMLVANPIIQYTVFEELKKVWLKAKKSLSTMDFFILGAISKLCATSITYPYIVVKSRMHLKDSADENRRYKSVLDGIRKIIKGEGVQGLYKGIESKLIQSVLTSAFTFALKEVLFDSSMKMLKLLKLRE